jgi:uncharacterized protein YcfJ
MGKAITNKMSKKQKTLLAGVTVVLLLAGTAALASYITKEQLAREELKAEQVMPVKKSQPKPAASTQPQQMASAQPQCDDGNLLGYLAGGAAGGVLGSQVGKGSGKTAATIGGVIGGAYLGGQHLPTRNATCR